MSLNRTPINRPLYALLALSLCCAPTYSWAQESDKPEKVTDAVDKTVSDEPPEPPAVNETSPSDYQASEEISQDLSVSFPADI